MDSSPPSPPLSALRRLPLLSALVLALAVLGYGWFIYQYCAPYAAGSDSSGYLNSARLLGQGQLTEAVRTIPGLDPPDWNYFYHQPLGYAVRPGQPVMVPTYPVGLPLHYLIASYAVGFEKAARVVNAVASVAAGLLLFALARALGLGRGWSVVATALLWGCPVWLGHALQPLSDCVATAWLLAAVLCALRAGDRLSWTAAAGAAFSIAVLVRPTSCLAILPLGLIIGRHARAAGAFVLAGLPAALFLGWYNHRLYGGVFQSGYSQGGSDLWSAFGRESVAGNLRFFAAWIPRVLSWPVVAFAVLGLPWLVRHQRRLACILALWFAAFVAFYAPYFCAGESWSYLRFLLPAFPAVLLAALLAAQRATAALPGPARRFAPAAFVAAGLAFQLSLADELHLTDIRSGERTYWVATRWITAHVPADAILLTLQLSGAVTFYNPQPLVRWDQITRADFELLRRTAARQHRPLYAPLFSFEQELFREKFGGPWTTLGRTGDVVFWRLDESEATLPDSKASR